MTRAVESKKRAVEIRQTIVQALNSGERDVLMADYLDLLELLQSVVSERTKRFKDLLKVSPALRRQLLKKNHGCGCANYKLRGVVLPADFDGCGDSADGKVFVGACSVCDVYRTDEQAAEAVHRATGWPIKRQKQDHRPYFAVTMKEAVKVSTEPRPPSKK